MFSLIEAQRDREVTVLWSVCRLVLALPGLVAECADLARDVLGALESR